jgi:hypothetical protein
MKQEDADSIEKRTGWAKPCPYCAEETRFTKFTNQQGPVPFFYSSSGKDLLLRRSDRERLDELYKSIGDSSGPSIQSLKHLWEDILNHAPEPPHGGQFTLWANVRCPHCDTEFPYNRGVKDDWLRIHEPAIIVIDGTTVVEDSRCYQVSVDVGAVEG